ncbi:protein indeterminate-domain 4, chloroplastic-like isoform X1 [Typha latifolia]|uniref:protein indeterminate-domain 4, chloroplastic-like isoform X1 n=2 Tax=Typha latifolia TaxID=4733 RepID=UPI003C2D7C51
MASASAAAATTAAPVKKKRNLPGNPNPDAEVIALSPRTLMATNRFVCEVCNKGFPREQNLQLHRRGHNLPWKLRQKSSTEAPRRRVYLCPEPTCVHHHPSRALGDLTGIKKHFCRKHGEKRWKCDKCSKRYAVQSDWKAHSKTCGTREYRCDCGTLFSRRDSFVTHRAFCDALAQESSRVSSTLIGNTSIAFNLSQPNSQIATLHNQSYSSTDLLRLGGGGSSQFDHLISPSNTSTFPSNVSNQDFNDHSLLQSKPFNGLMQLPNLQLQSNATPSSASNLFGLDFFFNGSTNVGNQNSQMVMPAQFNDCRFAGDVPKSLNIDTSMHNGSVINPAPQMSTTQLLQRATQMSAATTSSKSAMENDSHLQELMYLLSNGNSGIYGRSSCTSTGDRSEEDMAGLDRFDLGSYGMDGFKLQNRNIRGSDQLTRDFLGVGGVMRRSMANGLSQREQQHGIDMSCLQLDPDVKSSRSFAGGNLQ